MTNKTNISNTANITNTLNTSQAQQNQNKEFHEISPCYKVHLQHTNLTITTIKYNVTEHNKTKQSTTQCTCIVHGFIVFVQTNKTIYYGLYKHNKCMYNASYKHNKTMYNALFR